MPYLLFFLKKQKKWNCQLLQIIGGALMANSSFASQTFVVFSRIRLAPVLKHLFNNVSFYIFGARAIRVKLSELD